MFLWSILLSVRILGRKEWYRREYPPIRHIHTQPLHNIFSASHEVFHNLLFDSIVDAWDSKESCSILVDFSGSSVSKEMISVGGRWRWGRTQCWGERKETSREEKTKMQRHAKISGRKSDDKETLKTEAMMKQRSEKQGRTRWRDDISSTQSKGKSTTLQKAKQNNNLRDYSATR